MIKETQRSIKPQATTIPMTCMRRKSCGAGRYYVVRSLIKAGANVSHRDSNGRTALYWLAARQQNWSNLAAEHIAHELLKLIIESAIFCRDCEGNTAYEVTVGTWAEYKKGH